jgi:hypothetical protein
MLRAARLSVLGFMLLFALPLGANALMQWRTADWTQSWSAADWSSTGTLPPPAAHRPAMVRIYAARVGRWRGIFAVHSWIVVKEEGAPSYERFDKVGWGRPIRRNAYPPDGRWYGNEPSVVFAADGEEARALIPRIRRAVDDYPYGHAGDYRVWPGPNSNTFVAAVLAAMPETGASLPPTAIGKDYPAGGSWFGLARRTPESGCRSAAMAASRSPGSRESSSISSVRWRGSTCAGRASSCPASGASACERSICDATATRHSL